MKLEDENNLIDIGENVDIADCFFAVSDYDNKIKVRKRLHVSRQNHYLKQ